MSNALYPSRPILVVDDDRAVLDVIGVTLESKGITNVRLCNDSRDVAQIMRESPVEAVLLDLVMPHVDGRELLDQLSELYPDVPVLVITALDEVTTAVECMKSKAYDYLVKPVDANRLVSSIRRAVEYGQLQRENRRLVDYMSSFTLRRPEMFAHIVTQNEKMLALFAQVESVAESSEPILISGETGVGKELISRALYDVSGVTGDFVAVNLAGVGDEEFNRLVFGRLPDGTTMSERSLAERASGGVLYLDEIGELSKASQASVLQLIQDREYDSGDGRKRFEARLVLSTRYDLEKLIDTGGFRKDFYYRLNSHHFHVPSLRARLDDLPCLIDHFLHTSAEALGKKVPTAPKELEALLGSYHFPGNIRELEGMFVEAVSKHESRIMSLGLFKDAIGWKESAGQAPAGVSSKVTFSEKLPSLKEIQLQLIDEAMQRSHDNQAVAARTLRISRQALNRRLRMQDSEE